VYPFLKKEKATYISFDSVEDSAFKALPGELKNLFLKLNKKIDELRDLSNFGDKKAKNEYYRIKNKGGSFVFTNLKIFPEIMKKKFWILCEAEKYEAKLKAVEFEMALDCGSHQINLIFEKDDTKGKPIFAVSGKTQESIPEFVNIEEKNVFSKNSQKHKDIDNIINKIKIFRVSKDVNIVTSIDYTFSSINFAWNRKLKQVEYIKIISGNCFGNYSVYEDKNYALRFGNELSVFRFADNSVSELFYDGVRIYRRFVADTMCPEI